MGIVIDKLSGNPMLFEIAEDNLSPELQDIINSSNPIVYKHPRGDAEYVGNDPYQTSALLLGIGVSQTIYVAGSIKYIDVRMWGTATTAAEIRVYKSSSRVSLGNQQSFSELQLIETFNISAGNFNRSSVGFQTLILTNELNITVGEYLWIMANPSASTVTIPRWTTNSADEPYRDPLIFTFADDFTTSWYLGSTTYRGTPLILRKSTGLSVEQLNEGLATKEEILNPRITIPMVIYAVVGYQLNIDSSALILGTDCGKTSPKEYSVEYISIVGKSTERGFQFTPVSGDIGNKTIVINVYNSNHTRVATKTITLTVVAAANAGSVKNICQVGDSLIGANTITTTLQSSLNAIGGNVPLFFGFAGTSPANHQGIGGWRYEDFATAGQTYYKFTVTGATTVGYGATYTNNSSIFTVREVNLSGGDGYIKCSKSGTNNPDASGTLTKSAGTGDATITYSAYVAEAGNPFWNPLTSQLDIAYYRTNLGMGTNKFDLVTLQLGGNESFTSSVNSDATITSIINNIKSICAAFLADNASCKIIVMLTNTDGNTRGGWAANYGSSGYKEIYQLNIWKLREAIISNFETTVYSANVKIGIAGLACDRYYGYGRTTQAVSSRISETEEVHINAVHPITQGYNQIADAYLGQILYLLQ